MAVSRHQLKSAVVLVALCLQATSYGLIVEYARHIKGDENVKSVLIFFSEAIKLTVSSLLVIRQARADKRAIGPHFAALFWTSPVLLVPAAIYFTQNLLAIIALKHLNASTFTSLNQLKVLATGLFSVVMLQKHLSARRWRALGLLFIGALLVNASKQVVFIDASGDEASPTSVDQQISALGQPQLQQQIDPLDLLQSDSPLQSLPSKPTTEIPDQMLHQKNQLSSGGRQAQPLQRDATMPGPKPDPSETADDITSHDQHEDQNFALGVALVALLSLLSGFSGVYFEKVLKSKAQDFDVWDRNVQLASWSLILTVFGMSLDSDVIAEKGMFADFGLRTILIIALMALSGILTAFTVSYTSTIVKGFATSGAIVLSAIMDYVLFHEEINSIFVLGAACIVLSIFNYSDDPPAVPADARTHGAYAQVDTEEENTPSISPKPVIQQQLPESDSDLSLGRQAKKGQANGDGHHRHGHKSGSSSGRHHSRKFAAGVDLDGETSDENVARRKGTPRSNGVSHVDGSTAPSLEMQNVER